MNTSELKTTGWTRVEGISSAAELLDLGRMLGCPVPSPNGEIVKEIRVSGAATASPGSQSALHGRGPSMGPRGEAGQYIHETGTIKLFAGVLKHQFPFDEADHLKTMGGLLVHEYTHAAWAWASPKPADPGPVYLPNLWNTTAKSVRAGSLEEAVAMYASYFSGLGGPPTNWPPR